VKYCHVRTIQLLLLGFRLKLVNYSLSADWQRQQIDSHSQSNSCRRKRKPIVENRKIWTVKFNCGSNGNLNCEEKKKVPLVLLHGLCASLGLWAVNIDNLAKDGWTVYAIDVIGNSIRLLELKF
jgi:pimeloyl-ACP methyl ester carboxylesterase